MGARMTPFLGVIGIPSTNPLKPKGTLDVHSPSVGSALTKTHQALKRRRQNEAHSVKDGRLIPSPRRRKTGKHRTTLMKEHRPVSFVVIQPLGIVEIVEQLADEQAESHIHSRRLNASTWNSIVCLRDRDSAK